MKMLLATHFFFISTPIHRYYQNLIKKTESHDASSAHLSHPHIKQQTELAINSTEHVADISVSFFE